MAGQNHFLPGLSDAFHSYFNANEEYERRSYLNSYDSYPGSGYWHQLEEMASARQSSSIASGASNNTNARRANLLVQVWAENPQLL